MSNSTGFDTDDCTVDTCPLDLAYVHYFPNIAGNAIFLVVFALCLLVQLFLGIRHKTWGFLVGMTGGLILEVIGYGGRIMLHDDPFSFTAFVLYLVCLTIAPAFLTAAIYLCLGRIIVVYGEQFSRLKPRTYTILFVTCDIISLLLQAAGGGIASGNDDDDGDSSDTGVNIMIAGLAAQVVSLLIFIILALDCAWKIWSARKRGALSPSTSPLLHVTYSWRWKGFIAAIAIATLTIFVRSIFRVAELSEGFDSDLANDEITFMILEGTMVSIACIGLTLFHPGPGFQGDFQRANFRMNGKQYEKTSPSISSVEAGHEMAYSRQ